MVLNGKVQLIFITPENILEIHMFWNMLVSKIFKENLFALVVDQAHYIKMWADQFRKAFSMIGNLPPDRGNIMYTCCRASNLDELSELLAGIYVIKTQHFQKRFYLYKSIEIV